MDVGGKVADPATDLDQAQAQCLQGQPLGSRGHQPAADGVEQGVSGGMQAQADLGGQEAVAGEAVGKAGELQILDPVLALAPGGGPAIERVGIVGSTRDDEARVEALGLDDDTARLLPAPGLIGCFPQQAHP